MIRTILMVAPALAFALPFAMTPPSSARPLANPTDAAEWCWGDCDEDKDEDEGEDEGEEELSVCVALQLMVKRDYQCEIQVGPQCLASCSAEAMTPVCVTDLGDRARAHDLAACQGERAAACRSQCDGGGAAFCSDGARGADDRGSGMVFIDVDKCVRLDMAG